MSSYGHIEEFLTCQTGSCQLSIYPDLSAATVLRKKEFTLFTKILGDNGIQHKWGFQVNLIVGSPHICMNLDKVKEVLQQWNLLSMTTNSLPRKRASKPQAITPLWSEKQSKSKPIAEDWSFVHCTQIIPWCFFKSSLSLVASLVIIIFRWLFVS